MPPCGGAPYCRASSRKPNLARLLLAEIQAAEDLLLHLRRWMRTEPPPISQPLSTMS
jgi:hypothetical protein